jgi:hypothetical protein
MVTPTIAQKAPFGVDVEAGKPYGWCACGETIHSRFATEAIGGLLVPAQYECTETGAVWFCGCRQSRNQPLCDGSHNSL